MEGIGVTEEECKIVQTNLSKVRNNIANVCSDLSRDIPQLVAISKTKPVALIQACYDAGHRCFGENYVKEIISKANALPEDIGWHFVGHLQSNKCKDLVNGVRNLVMVESVDSQKLAALLNKAVEHRCVDTTDCRKPLKVMVQVNTSGEKNKAGVPIADVVDLARFVNEECPFLLFCGLMTIGLAGDTDDFARLVECRENILREVNVPDFQLSMGMSGDYLEAIKQGSTNVRVGSIIFGARNYPVPS